MKVLQVIPSYEPAWAHGGTVTATSNLCRELESNDVDVTVFTTNVDGDGGKLDVPVNEPVDVGGVEVWYFNCTIGKRSGFYSRPLSKALHEQVADYSLVHSSTIFQQMQKAVHKECKRTGIPYIVSPHSNLMEKAFSAGPSFIKNPYYKYLIRDTVEDADAIHFLCEGERERSRDYISDTDSFIVPNGIEIENYRCTSQKTRDELAIDDSTLLLLHLGRIDPKKNIHKTIESMEPLIEDGLDIEFLICGYTSDKSYQDRIMNKISGSSVSDRIHWYGSVNSDRIPDIYNSADVLVLPSDIEGISMTTIEAMAAGLPLLVSDRVANYREIELDNAGLIVEPSTESIQKALKKLYNSADLVYELSENAQRSAENRYSIEEVAINMKKAYQDTIENNKSSKLRWDSYDK